MRRHPQDCSQWSVDSDHDSPHNIFATLSHNLRKYEQEYRSFDRKPKSYRISKQPTEKVTINTLLTDKDIAENKENDHTRQQENFLSKPLELEKTHRRLFHPAKPEQRENRSRLHLRAIKTSHEQREDMQLLKTREVKFEKKDKKRFKDRCVDIFAELRGNRTKISLKQIDDINKQTKEEKIELFLRLLKR